MHAFEPLRSCQMMARLLTGALVALPAACISGPAYHPATLASPMSTTHIAPFRGMIDRTQRVIAHEMREMERTGRPTAQLPNLLANADAIVASVLLGQAGDYVIVTRELHPQGAVCRYHGGATGDRQTICIDARGQTWRLAVPDLATTVR